MANSFVRFTQTGSTTTYSLGFTYRSQADISVTLNGVATTAFSYNAAGTQIIFNTAPATGTAIQITRATSQDSKLVDYAEGSVLTEGDLDTDSAQGFFMGQEAIDKANDVIGVDATNFQWTAGNLRITNVADPTSAQDVATKNYLETVWLSSSDKTNLTTVAGLNTEINTVATKATEITNVSTDIANVNTVATNIGSVNTVATDITKVIAVANDLAEAVSEIETVADDLNEATSEIDTVSNNIANVNAVGLDIANVNAVATDITNVNQLAGALSLETTFVVTVASGTLYGGGSGNVFYLDGTSNPTLTLDRGATYIFDLSNSSNSGHPLAFKDGSGNSYTTGVTSTGTVGTTGAKVTIVVASNAPSSLSYYCTVHGNGMGNTISVVNNNLTTVATNITGINNVSNAIANVNAVGNNTANINTVAGIDGNVTTVAGLDTEISNVSAKTTEVTNVSNSITNVNTVATNLTNVNAFSQTYLGAFGTAPAATGTGAALANGMLYFDTSSSILKVYASGSGWQSAGSSVNGTADRFQFTVSSASAILTGNDVNGNSLAYDANFIDVFLNGVKMRNGSDVTVTSGSSLVFANTLQIGDIVDAIAYGTFAVANLNATNITSGTVGTGRLPTVPTTKGGTGLTSLGTAGQALVVNGAGNALQFANASSAEVYGFNMSDTNSDGILDSLTVTTTNGGVDSINSATYSAFDDVLYAATGFSWSLNASGHLIATV